MKKLLSLPPCTLPSFHDTGRLSRDEWFCSSDPGGQPLGSAGGSTWLLEGCRRSEAPDLPFSEWLCSEKRIIIHAGGQSRRLPAYATSGKILTPIPVFRWARGQKLSQDLLSLQLPLYEEIMLKAPSSFHTMIASGDVYIRSTERLQDIPGADIVCYGLWTDPVLAGRHGVFLSGRNTPGVLDFMIQKPSITELSRLSRTHLFLMDIGIWLLSDRAVELMVRRSGGSAATFMYDLYGEFGLSLGMRPRVEDVELNGLSVAVLPLPGGEFYHYGTGRELISSTLAVQNLVHDQRAIMQRALKPHPAMFVQNAAVDIPLTAANSELWIENSHIAGGWRLTRQHILTGIPCNDWSLDLSPGMCIDVVPVGEHSFAARPYGFDDMFRGDVTSPDTRFMGRPFIEWAAERSLPLPQAVDIQDAPVFPVCDSVDMLGAVLAWMTGDGGSGKVGKALWEGAVKVSAADLLNRANIRRLAAQREAFRRASLSMLAANHEKSVFYQLDLSDASREFADGDIRMPQPAGDDAPLMKRIHDSMFRSTVLRLKGCDGDREEQEAFSLLAGGLIEGMSGRLVTPTLSVHRDQIVWGRSPVRIDLAGGWTDTPPYCLYAGGKVVNVAIELNGQPPLQVYIKPSSDHAVTLRSIDLGAMEKVTSWEELGDYNRVGSPFSIPKAALALAGFMPAFSAVRHTSLAAQLRAFDSGMEITLLSAIPAGSGLGTSSILAATVLGALSDFCGLGWDKNEVGNRTLILEQLLTTGGGWQDPFGGVLHGIKLLQTTEGFDQSPLVRWLPGDLFTDLAYRPCHLLYYTGITRTAKDILAQIVRSMFLNSHRHIALLDAMKAHALDMYEAIQYGDFRRYGLLVDKTWEQKKAIDPGTNPPSIEAIISLIKDYALGCKLPGAGGGGYLYIVAKDPGAATRIRHILATAPLPPNARPVEMSLSPKGLQISRS
jgi:galactokinase/mevalonate kinase-like predicted kinase